MNTNAHSSVNNRAVNMSYHPYRLQSIEDERRLLQKMLVLQDRVRMAREKDRRLKSSQTSHYKKMFQPITNSLNQLKVSQVPKVDSSTSTAEPLPTEKIEPDENIEPDEMIEPDELIEPDEKNEPKEIENDEDDSVTIKNNPGEMYLKAVNSIPERLRDDGVFGLNLKTKRIGDYTYMVDGNTLHIVNDDGEVRSYVIEDYKLWQLLLVKRPNDIRLKLFE